MGDCSTSIGTVVVTSANVQVSQVPTTSYFVYPGPDGYPMGGESTIYIPVSYTNYDVVTQTLYGPCPVTATTPPPETQPAPTPTSSFPAPDSPPPASFSSPAQVVTQTLAVTSVQTQTQVQTSMATATQTVVSSMTSSGFVFVPVAGNRSTIEIRHQITVVGNVSSTVFLDGSGNVVSLTTDASGATAIIGGANSSESPAAEKGSTPTGAIIGGIIGAAVVAILALLFCIRRRKSQSQLRERQALSAKNMSQLSGARYGPALPSDEDDARTVYSQASGAPAQLGSSTPADWSRFEQQQGYGTSTANLSNVQRPHSLSSAYTPSHAGDTVRSARSITPQEQRSWFNGRGLSIFTKTESRRPSTRGSLVSNNSSLTIKRVEKGAIGSPTNFVHSGTGDDESAAMGYYNTVSEKGALGSLSRSGSLAETVQLRQMTSPSPKQGADLSRNSSVVSSVATGLSDFDWYRSPSAMSSEAKKHGMRTPSPALHGPHTEWRSSTRTDVNDFEFLDIADDDDKKMGTFGRRS